MKRIVLSLLLASCVLASQAIAQSRTKASSSSTKASSSSTKTSPTSTKTSAASAKASPTSTKASPRASSSASRSHDRSPSSSGSDLGLKRIGAAFGYVSPENIDGTLGLGIFADCGHVTPNVAIESRLDYWSHSAQSFGVETSVRDVVVGARGKYFFETRGSSLQPFLGAGLGLHFIHAEATPLPISGLPATTIDDSSTKLGLDLGGGVAHAINPQVNLLGEAWYGIVSDMSQFSLRFGLSYKLGS